MACDVLVIDTQSPLRAEKGLISPLPYAAQLTGFLEQEEISFEIIFPVPQDDGTVGVLQGSTIVQGGFEAVLLDNDPKVVLFLHDTELIHYMLAVLQAARETLPKAFFCVASGPASAQPEYFFGQGIDFVCGRKGPDVFYSFPSLVQEIKKNGGPPRGTLYAVDHHYKDLNAFPLISKRYFKNVTPQWFFPTGDTEKFGIVLGSLGCTSGCAHCPNSSYWGSQWIPMSAGRIFSEIKAQREEFGFKTFYFGDINFFPATATKGEIDGVHPYAAERMKQLDLLLTANAPDTRFISTVRPDVLCTLKNNSPALLDNFLKYYFACFLGFESFSPDVLAGLDRGITKNMLRTAIRVLEERNITIVASFLVGSEWETSETLSQTLAFIMEELPPSSIPLLNIMTPFPGTKFYGRLHAQGLIPEKNPALFNGQHMLFKHPVFQQGEIEEKIKDFYYSYFTERYTG
ncbi:MAG: radical SAM protein [Pseudomonadota bacterium]